MARRNRIRPDAVRPSNARAAIAQVEANLRHRRLTGDADVLAAVIALLEVTRPEPLPPIPVRRTRVSLPSVHMAAYAAVVAVMAVVATVLALRL